MPSDLPDPSALLAIWAAGLALGASLVARWKIVGPGFLWASGGAALLIAVFSVPLGPIAGGGLVSVAIGVALARRPPVASLFLGFGAILLAASALSQSRWVLVVTGMLALGGTSSEMLLGHWYLIDPKLPRWSLRALDAVGIAGLLLDVAAVIAFGGLMKGGVIRWVFAGLAVTGIVMMTGVWFSLRERGYEGVMAATGLSYLSVLTALGSVAVGRFLLG